MYRSSMRLRYLLMASQVGAWRLQLLRLTNGYFVAAVEYLFFSMHYNAKWQRFQRNFIVNSKIVTFRMYFHWLQLFVCIRLQQSSEVRPICISCCDIITCLELGLMNDIAPVAIGTRGTLEDGTTNIGQLF
jgi:hypothetical protein